MSGRVERSNSIILVVNNEEAVRNAARQLLEPAGYRVLEAPDAGEALEIFRQRVERIDLLLTDVTMPKMSGRELAEHGAASRPRMKVIYMAGDVERLLRQGVLTPDMAYLRKPFTEAELSSKVNDVLLTGRRRRVIACPRCSSTKVRRARSRWFDWLLLMIFVLPYRCRDCRTRFYRFRIMIRH